ncbi:hypothetical protein NDU88_002459 [Pleurodeles waltl]|uniref:Uncharacterized protein n=1 Tax=Pleurodeles waltl TaxID=8319 RepID=A0AAV7VZQ4_PLEWA|nr:hypothetical protein NDU88_002459 [Pleurodeles waltl]
MHRVPVQARFAPSSRRLRPPRSSSPEAVHGVKPPRSTPRRCRVDCDQTSSEGSCQRSSGGTPELSPLTLIPSGLPSGVGRHVVCAPRSLSEHRRRAGPHCSSAWDPRGNHQDPLYFLSPRGVSGKGAGNCFSGSSATGDAIQIAAAIFFFSAALRRPPIRPRNSLHSGTGPLKMSLGTPAHIQPGNGAVWGSTAFQAGPEWESLAGASRRGFLCHRRQATPPSASA